MPLYLYKVHVGYTAADLQAQFRVSDILQPCKAGLEATELHSLQPLLLLLQRASPLAAGGDLEAVPIPDHPAIMAAVKAMTSATAGRKPLPLPAFNLCFPILESVLAWPEISPLHDSALAILGLHVKPEPQVPRQKMLKLLFHVLGTIPAYR